MGSGTSDGKLIFRLTDGDNASPPSVENLGRVNEFDEMIHTGVVFLREQVGIKIEEIRSIFFQKES